MAETSETKKPLFRALDAQVDLDEMETSVIESLCMKCHENVSIFPPVTWAPQGVHVARLEQS